MASRLAMIANWLSKPAEPVKDQEAVRREQERMRDDALVEMRLAIKALERNLNRRQHDMEGRLERAQELVGQGDENGAANELAIYEVEEATAQKMRLVHLSQQQMYIKITALNEMGRFARAAGIFDETRQIDVSTSSMGDLERVMLHANEQLDEFVDSHAQPVDTSAATPRRSRRVQSLLTELKDKTASARLDAEQQASAEGGNVRAGGPTELQSRLESRKRDIELLRRTRGEP